MAEIATALDGIRVIDFTRFQAGPRGTLMLARMGAEVIHVEEPEGDEGRGNTPIVRGQSVYWVQYNSGKKSLTLNINDEAGKEILRRLVKVSDIFVQNFRPGIMQKWGFGYDVISQLNPRIIMVNVSGYGQYGPYRDLPGVDVIGQAMSGHMFLTGFPETPPTRAYFSIIDRTTALHATIGALAALREREISGRGQSLEVCLLDTGYSLTEEPITAYLQAGIVPQRQGNRSRGPGAVSNTFLAKDGWIWVGANNKNQFKLLCQLLGHLEWLEDPRFTVMARRHEVVGLIEQETGAWVAARTQEEAVREMRQAGIIVAPVNDIPTAAKDPHLWERELLVEVPDPIAGKMHVSGKLIKFSRSQTIVGSPPTVGQHNEEILCGLLGYAKEELPRLREHGII